MMKSVPVYVINLERSGHRLALISSALHAAGLEFERVPAIDGLELEPSVSENSDQSHHSQYLAPLSPREVACFLSHRRAWQTFLNTVSHPYAIFLEDDAAPLPGCQAMDLFTEAFANSARAEIIKLYHPPSTRWRAPGGAYLRRPLVPSLGAVAYAMNRPAAQTLLNFTTRFHEPVDVALQRWWDHGVRVSEAHPSLFGEAAGVSTIRHVGQKPAEGRLLREIRRPLFQLRQRFHAVCALVRGRFP